MPKKYLLLGVLVVLFSCSPQKRLKKLLTNHPELVDTTTKRVKVNVQTKVIRDTVLLEKLNIDYDLFINDALKELDSLKSVKDCESISNKVITKIKYIDKIVKKKDTVYSIIECVIAPFDIDTLGIHIKGKYEHGKLYLEFKDNNHNHIIVERKAWQYIEFWFIVVLLIYSIYVNSKNSK